MTANRQLFDVPLRPVQGSRFAPTGFPDLGAATFERPTDDGGWERCILVESAQSMANRLELTLWDEAQDDQADVIADLPYIRIHGDDGGYLTSSRTESHRLASPYVRNAVIGETTVRELTVERFGLSDSQPHDYRHMAREIFALDPLTLLHGVFFAGKGAKDYPGQPKFLRIVTAFIEASDVKPAESGGVKQDHVHHTQAASGSDSTEGYGSVPFQRTEWTARNITASFNIDLAQLRSYGLPEVAESLLLSLAQLEIRTFLDRSLRLRTNCDLELIDQRIADRNGVALPGSEELTASVKDLVAQAKSEDLLGEGVLTAVWTHTVKGSK